jgi:WD40 repeat protein
MRLVLPLLAGFLLLVSCDLLDENGKNSKKSTLPDGSVVVASMDGNEPALWLFNPQTLKRTAVIETEERAPRGMAFSSNYERWYLSWGIGSQLDGNARNVRAVLDPASRRIIKRVATPDLSIGGYQLIYEPKNDHVVAYGNGSGDVQFFDAETLELVHERSIGDPDSFVAAAVVAEERGKIYFGADTESEDQIYVYDTADQEISSAIPLPGPPPSFSDLALSPDERYLFATTWSSLGGPGRFYMVDLDTGETVFDETPVGKKANLAVSPNGSSVYIDCPAGGLWRQFVPSQKVLRFNVEAREIDVFIDGGEALGLGDYALIADQITMLPGGKAFVIQNRVPASVSEEEVKGEPSLLKVDAETGDVLATYVLPRDARGRVRAGVRQLHFGIVAE